jgi:proline dehydrogenase
VRSASSRRFLQKFGVRSLKERQREDLREIVQALRRLGLPITIEAYYAEKSPDGKVRFIREV